MPSTLSTFDFALKERYSSSTVEKLCCSDRPFLAHVKKDENFQGDVMPIPLIHVAPQGVSGDFSSAGTNATNLVGKKFNLSVGDFFGAVDIGDKVIKASRGNPGAFLQNKSAEIDGLYEQMADDLSLACFVGNGGIPIGRRASVSSETVTLTEPEDVVNFEIGMTVRASDATGSGGTDALRVGDSYVTAVDREAGTVTLEDVSDITSFADDDYLFRDGNFAGNTTVVIFHGLGSFLYSSSTSVPDLYGMVRTSDPIRLAGSRVPSADLTGLGIEERLQLLITRMTGRYKSKNPDKAWLHPEDWNRLQLSLQSRGQQPMQDDSAKFGFETLSIIAGGARVKVYSDRHCPKGTAFVTRSQNWTLHSMDKLVHTRNGDGLQMLRKTATNDYRYELLSYPALSTNAPLYGGRVAV